MSTLDRDAAEAAVEEYDRKFDSVEAPSLYPGEPHEWMRDLLDALEGCVRPAPAQTIDRAELKSLLWQAARHGEQPGVTADSVLALLQPIEQQTIGRDALLDLLVEEEHHPGSIERFADAILALLRPAEQQTIDRHALADLLEAVLPTRAELAAKGTTLEVVVDAILALLRPVDGDSEYEVGYITGQRDAANGYWRRDVDHGGTLTRDEVALVRRCLLDEQYEEPDYSACHALVARLGAAS